MLLNKKECICGKDHKSTKFDKYIPNKDWNFYGGRVSMIGLSHTCECGRVLKGYFGKNYKDELELIDLEIIEDVAEKATEIDTIVEDSTNYDISYEDMTYKELQEVARAEGIKNVNLKRELLLEAIEEARK
jgi:hypothetical protein